MLIKPKWLPVLGLVLTAVAALVIVWRGLIVPALLGLLVYAWTCLLADRIVKANGNGREPVAVDAAPRWAAGLSGAIVGVLVITVFVLITFWTIRLGYTNDLRIFLLRIEGSLDVLRHALPESLAIAIPEDLTALKSQAFALLRSKAAELGSLGGTVVHIIIQGLFAILVGALAAVATWKPRRLHSDQFFISRLLLILERVVIAQLRIAIFNTSMTALYLFVILPAFGFVLPFRGLLCMFTLMTGILPVLGNLLANTVLALISFAVSPWLAIASLIYLIAIHKTEYFINARTVGSRVSVASWEILAAMLTGEALFGVPGLVTAPLLYPFFKREISRIWVRESEMAAQVTPSPASPVAGVRLPAAAEAVADHPPATPAGQAALHELPSVWARRSSVETIANGAAEPPTHVSGVSERR